MYVSSRQGYKPPVESTGKVKEYTHFASLKYCNGAETFYTYAPSAPYNGEDNNDYVDGKGFCCNDGSLEAAQTRALARAAKNNYQEGDTYEKMQFYYHPDHLGIVVVTSPTLTVRWCSISSMYLSARYS